MKLSNIPAALLAFLCILLLPVMANSALKPPAAGNYPAGPQLADIFNVAVAREPVYLILVEKNLQRLRVLEYDTELRVVAEYFSATGENYGIKKISGDSKTPEGIYFITRIFKDDEITIFGDRAFHLDYPNFFDQEADRNGNGIYIHGTNKKLLPNSTNGCVTLANRDLDDLENYLTQAVTPVIIVQDLAAITKSESQLLAENDYSLTKSLLLNEEITQDKVDYNYLYIITVGNQTVAVSDFIYRPFSRSIMRGTSRTYLEYYQNQGWTARKRLWRVSPLQIYPESPVKVAARPLTTGEVQLAETTEAETAAMMAALTPQLIALENPGVKKPFRNVSRIAAPAPPEVQIKSLNGETGQQPATEEPVPLRTAVIPPTPAPQSDVPNRIGQPQNIEVATPVAPRDEQQIVDFVESWRQAWTSKAIEPYIAFYDKSFRSGGKNLAQWKSHKAKLNKTYQFISVNISDIEVNWTSDGASVSFRQEYRSDRYKAKGNKTLHLIYSDRGWKIKRETYSRI